MLKFIKSLFGFTKSIILTILLICLVVFMVSNRDVITIHTHPLPFEIESRVYLVMLFFFLFGMSFGFLAFSKNLIEKTIANFKNRLKIKKLEKEITKN